jgi:hypothetical protein
MAEPTDRITYNPDGTITVDTPEGPWTIRRPTIRVYRDLRNRIVTHSRSVTAFLAELEAARAGGADPITTDTEDKRQAELEDEQVAILLDVMRMLREPPVGDDFDAEALPAWMIRLGLMARWSNHWAQVPLAPGPADSPAGLPPSLAPGPT